MNAPPLGITPCQGPVLLGTCAHQDLWLLGDTSAPLWYPLAWRDWHRDSYCVPLGTGTTQCPSWEQLHATVRHRDSSVSTLGTGTTLSPLGMRTAQCP